MYKYVLSNSVVKIPMMFAKYFEYYAVMLRGGRFFVDTLYKYKLTSKMKSWVRRCAYRISEHGFGAGT